MNTNQDKEYIYILSNDMTPRGPYVDQFSIDDNCLNYQGYVFLDWIISKGLILHKDTNSIIDFDKPACGFNYYYDKKNFVPLTDIEMGLVVLEYL